MRHASEKRADFRYFWVAKALTCGRVRLTMMSARLFPVLLVSLLASATAACAASSDDGTGSDESHVDTSGCTGSFIDTTKGPVEVKAERPPTSGCWNIQTGGMSVSYAWVQTNDSTPEKKDLGFYVSLNGAGTSLKASSMACKTATGGISMGADTSGTQTFACTASVFVPWKDNANMVKAGYDASGHRVAWDVAVAVALDNENHWDSLNGANYHFPM